MSKLKGYYIKLSDTADIDEAIKGNGVFKKVKAQAETLSKHFDLTLDLVVSNNKQTALSKIKRRLPLTAIGHRWIYDAKYDDADFIYIRKDTIDHSLYRFLMKIKNKNPKCKILMEIPTYPYDQEIKQAAHSKIFYIKDVVNRNKLHKCVDRVVLCHKADEVFKIPALYMPNGFDFENNQMRQIADFGETISIVGVAFLNFWHGYDRLIKGMGAYYANGGTRDIVFHCVGSGVVLPELKQLAKDTGMENRVIFHGSKQGKELDTVYDQCNLAVDSLANFRREVYLSSSLKSREYFAKGFPIINSGAIDFIDKDYKYLLDIPENNDAVDVEDIIRFFDSVYQNKTLIEVGEEVRKYAEERCSWDITLRDVIKYINGWL